MKAKEWLKNVKEGKYLENNNCVQLQTKDDFQKNMHGYVFYQDYVLETSNYINGEIFKRSGKLEDVIDPETELERVSNDLIIESGYIKLKGKLKSYDLMNRILIERSVSVDFFDRAIRTTKLIGTNNELGSIKFRSSKDLETFIKVQHLVDFSHDNVERTKYDKRCIPFIKNLKSYDSIHVSIFINIIGYCNLDYDEINIKDTIENFKKELKNVGYEEGRDYEYISVRMNIPVFL